jgi:putative ABC transport system ATP-binding protein
VAHRDGLILLVGVTELRLEAHELYRFFHAGDEEVLALRGVSLTADAGETVAVVGPSGSGKSTLLACLAGLDRPDGGTVRIDGLSISRRSEADRAAIRARSVGVVYQADNLIGHLTVEGNVALAQRLGGSTRPRSRRDLLDRLGIGGRARAYPAQLSGGEAVRAALAVALANNPTVLVADEPTGELDSSTESQVLDLLQDRAEAGTAIVVATHSEAVAAMAQRIVRLVDGLVAA